MEKKKENENDNKDVGNSYPRFHIIITIVNFCILVFIVIGTHFGSFHNKLDWRKLGA